MIDWPDYTLPPVNQNNLPCALWFYQKEVYDMIMDRLNSIGVNTREKHDGNVT